MGEVLQVYETPDVDLPIAPAGEQNAPGLTMSELLEVTGVGVGVITKVATGVGVAEGVGVEVLVGTPMPQELINEFNLIASCESTVKEYLVFMAIQFSV